MNDQCLHIVPKLVNDGMNDGVYPEILKLSKVVPISKRRMSNFFWTIFVLFFSSKKNLTTLKIRDCLSFWTQWYVSFEAVWLPFKQINDWCSRYCEWLWKQSFCENSTIRPTESVQLCQHRYITANTNWLQFCSCWLEAYWFLFQ